MNKIFAFILIFCFSYIKFHCQVNIGSPLQVDNNVLLDLKNSENRGLLLPFSNTISSPEGNIFYNNNHKMISLIDNVGENLLSPWKYYSNSLGIVKFGLDASVNIGVGITVPSVKFHLKGNTAAKGNQTGGAFQIGLGGEQHIVMDSIRIISKSNNNTESILKLQHLNGHVEIGNHYSSNIDNTASGLNGPVPSGGIIMWSGSESNIPDGWLLCDGRPRTATEDTPDLSGRFIVGIGSNGESSYSLGLEGGSDNVTLTISNMPSHNHTGSTASDGAHTHTVSDRYVQGGSDHAKANLGSHNYKNHTTTRTTSSAGGHTHIVTIGSKGSGTAFSNRPKYYALCFIMKK